MSTLEVYRFARREQVKALRESRMFERLSARPGALRVVGPAFEVQRHGLRSAEDSDGFCCEFARERQKAPSTSPVCAPPAESRGDVDRADLPRDRANVIERGVVAADVDARKPRPERTKPVTSPTSCSLPSGPCRAGTPVTCSAAPPSLGNSVWSYTANDRTRSPSRSRAAAVENTIGTRGVRKLVRGSPARR
jgi:hypothetical protein